MSEETDQPLSEAQELLKRLKEKSEQSKASAAAGLSASSILSSLSFKDKPLSSGTVEGGKSADASANASMPPPPPMPSYRSGQTRPPLDLLPVTMPLAETTDPEETDATTITTGTKIVLRNGLSGSCLSVRPLDTNNENESRVNSSSIGKSGAAPSRYRATADGFGFGDSEECIYLANRHAQRASQPSSTGVGGFGSDGAGVLPIRYGDRVMLRSRAAREKCLSAPQPPKPGATAHHNTPPPALAFERNVGGKAEDWEVLPAALNHSDTPGFALVGRQDRDQVRRVMASSSSQSKATSSSSPLHSGGGGGGGGGLGWLDDDELKAVAGQHVRAGDRIALRSVLTGDFLGLCGLTPGDFDVAGGGRGGGSRPSSSGVKAGWQVSTAREGVFASHEAATWTVGVAGTPYLPPWSERRPYLSGKFLLKPQRHHINTSSSSSSPSSSSPSTAGSSGGRGSGGDTGGSGGGGGAYGCGNAPLHVVERLFGPQPHASLKGLARGGQQASVGTEGGEEGALSSQQTSLGGFPVAVQEQLLLDDLLCVFMGLEGKYIKLVPNQPPPSSSSSSSSSPSPSEGSGLSSVSFGIPSIPSSGGEGVDFSLAQQVERMLPLGSAYVRVKALVWGHQRHEHGLVAHALGAAVKVLLKEYLVLVAQLEHQYRTEKLSLQKLWFFIQPALHTLAVLNSVCDACSSSSSPSSTTPPTNTNNTPPASSRHACVGGELLNRLQALSEVGGDDKSQEVLSFLYGKAAVPYLDMLRRWVYEGVLDDPYSEFMVTEDASLSTTEAKSLVSQDFTTAYWERRYSLRQDSEGIATFLHRSADKVLTTGKYLNVVRECGVAVVCPDALLPSGSAVGEVGYGEVVERAFRFASKTLLSVLLEGHSLLARLRSMKHYFLLDQGDLYVNFMDLADQELRKEMGLVSKQRVEALLQLAVSQSCCGTTDAFKDDLTCDFAPFSMIQHLEAIHSKDGVSHKAAATQVGATLKGIEVFMLDYKVSWPVSLVVSKRSITKYQLIFRHLFFARHVERCLKATWQGQQALKELGGVRAAGGRSYCLRHRMLGFMQSIVYYFMYEVVEPRWLSMENKLRHCDTMDEVLLAHAELQDAILKECLLTSQELLKILTKIMTICLLFAEQMNRFFEANRLREERAEQPSNSGPFSPSVAAAQDARKAFAKSAQEGASASFKEKGERNPLAHNGGEEAGEKGGAEGHGSLGQLPVGVEGTGRGDSTAIRNARISDKSHAIQAELELPSYIKMIFSYEKNFDQLLREFMGRLAQSARFQTNSHLANLVTRLDYNGFFSQNTSSSSTSSTS